MQDKTVLHLLLASALLEWNEAGCCPCTNTVTSSSLVAHSLCVLLLCLQLFGELDYVQEGRNAVKFKELYGDIPGIYVPSINFDLTSRCAGCILLLPLSITFEAVSR